MNLLANHLKKQIDIYLTTIFWVACLFFIFNKTEPIIKNIISINSFNKKYFETMMNGTEVTYREIKVRPKTWVDLKQISKKAIGAIIVSEDGKFFMHHGYDIEQIQKVLIDKFILKKKKVRGASTITQQLIKNIYLTKEKSFDRKIKELYLANYIEDHASKDKILEVYLNVIEYGKNIYGIESASQFYFKKSAKYLTAKEGAFLAMLLPSPVKYMKSFKEKGLTPFANGMVNSILIKMRMSGYISDEELISAMNSPLSFEKFSVSDEDMKIENENNLNGESDEQN